jgi:SPP1 gp7 family putative phage head morphogenesis protein
MRLMSLQSDFIAGEKAYTRLEKETTRRLIRNYQAALKEIRADIALVFEKYGGNYTEMVKYNRLANLEKDISDQIRILTGKNAMTLKQGTAGAFEDSFYRTGFAIEREAQKALEVQVKLRFGMLSPKTIEAAVQNPLDRYGAGKRKDSLGFLFRNSKNSETLVRQLNEQLTQGLIRGESYQNVAKRIKERMDVGATNTLRVAHTEMHRCHVEGRLAGFQQAEKSGVELDYIWTATVDDRTRDMHADMDGRKADAVVDGRPFFALPDGITVEGPGLTGIPEHDINCRCGVRAEVMGYSPELRRVRGQAEPVPYQTYHQWYEARILKVA